MVLGFRFTMVYSLISWANRFPKIIWSTNPFQTRWPIQQESSRIMESTRNLWDSPLVHGIHTLQFLSILSYFSWEILGNPHWWSIPLSVDLAASAEESVQPWWSSCDASRGVKLEVPRNVTGAHKKKISPEIGGLTIPTHPGLEVHYWVYRHWNGTGSRVQFLDVSCWKSTTGNQYKVRHWPFFAWPMNTHESSMWFPKHLQVKHRNPDGIPI
jgi:hypothetical protein